MSLRIKAFALHISISAGVICITLGSLYLGWYRWPGWYLTGSLTVTAILVVVDLTLGPLFTLLVADPEKPRRELARDLAVIVTVQLIAFVYGVTTLWLGRPLYYVFWVNQLKVVAASEVTAAEAALMRKQNPQFAPHWYSSPQWVWAPQPFSVPIWLQPAETVTIPLRPADETLTTVLNQAAAPHDFRPLSEAGDQLRAHLRRVDEMSVFSSQEKRTVKQRMAQRGLRTDAPDAIALSGFGRPLVAVFDRASLTVRALIRAN
jgi:hypothetical protein